MGFHYSLSPIKFSAIEELPSAWGDRDYKALPGVMKYRDISDLSDSELKDMPALPFRQRSR